MEEDIDFFQKELQTAQDDLMQEVFAMTKLIPEIINHLFILYLFISLSDSLTIIRTNPSPLKV